MSRNPLDWSKAERELVELLLARLRQELPWFRGDLLLTRSHVILYGEVESYYSKQLAQEALRKQIGNRTICNELVVVSA